MTRGKVEMTEPHVVRLPCANPSVTCPVIFHDDIRLGNSTFDSSNFRHKLPTSSEALSQIWRYLAMWGLKYVPALGVLFLGGDISFGPHMAISQKTEGFPTFMLLLLVLASRAVVCVPEKKGSLGHSLQPRRGYPLPLGPDQELNSGRPNWGSG